jgi:DNA-binding transcriptional LysR family regulator
MSNVAAEKAKSADRHRNFPIRLADLAQALDHSEEGFALTDQVLATDAIVEGWLVRPFNFDMKDHWHYWIVRGKGQKETVPVRAFRVWMMGEIADTNRKFAQLSGQKPPAVAG